MKFVYTIPSILLIILILIQFSKTEKIKGTHWNRIGKRFKYVELKDILQGKIHQRAFMQSFRTFHLKYI
jgi:hypothetical protein